MVKLILRMAPFMWFCIVLVWAYILLFPGGILSLENMWTGKAQHNELLAAMNLVPLGCDERTAINIIFSEGYYYMRPRLLRDGSGIWLQTPYMILNRNWRGHIDFKDGRVVGLRIRRQDAHGVPHGAPPDKLLPSHGLVDAPTPAP